MALFWAAALLSPQPKADSCPGLPANSLGETSYSPLLDFLLGNCKRKQKQTFSSREVP